MIIANDLDCLIINVWRALKYAPNELAKMCVDPVSHVLHIAGKSYDGILGLTPITLFRRTLIGA